MRVSYWRVLSVLASCRWGNHLTLPRLATASEQSRCNCKRCTWKSNINSGLKCVWKLITFQYDWKDAKFIWSLSYFVTLRGWTKCCFFLLFSSFKWYCVSQKKLRPGCASTDNSTTSSGNESFLQWNLCEQMIYSWRQRNFEQLSHTGQLWSSWRHESVQLTSYKPAMIMRNESNMEKACCSITRHASCRFIAEVGFSLHVKTRG